MSGFRHGLRSGLDQIRANPLESILVAFAVFAIGVTMTATARIALTGDRTQDLTFAGATDELGRMLSNRGSARLARLERTGTSVRNGSAVADTIAILADTVAEPAFAVGGFVHDHVMLYNDFAVREAMQASPGGERSEARTLLQTAWTDDGKRMLSDRPSAYGIIIRSPYAEGTWREVRTIDWRSNPGLLGFDGEIALSGDQPAGLFRGRLNGRDCSINRESPDYYMYCKSALGADAKRFYDFGLRVEPENGGKFVSAGPYRQRNVWMNGRSETFGQRPVNGGDVFDADGVGPFLLSSSEWGTLAAAQWINGRRSFANPRLGTLSFFAPAGRSSGTANSGTGPLVLSFDAALTADLDRETTRFMAANQRLLQRVVVVVMDVRSGEVRALSEPARTSGDEPLVSFQPILVGSVVKPIMAAAILSRQPDLGTMRLSYAGDTVTSVGGIALNRGFANDANGCPGEIVFADFLRCSSNQYAAELLVRSLQHDGFTSRGAGAVVPRAVLEKSAIATGLADVFDVDASANRTTGRLALYWNPDSGSTPGALAAMSDRSLIPYESRPWILFPDSSGTRIDWVARYAFGGWENRWTLLGLSQAYARIATGRNVQATFLHRPGAPSTTPRFPAATPRAESAFAVVRSALVKVGQSGTAAGLTEHLRNAIEQPVTVLAKTGTLNEGGPGGRLKTLAIAVGPAASMGDTSSLSCGLVAVTYFEFVDQENRKGMHVTLPRVHRDFAEGPLSAVIGRNWHRVSGCPAPVAPGAPPKAAARVAKKSAKA